MLDFELLRAFVAVADDANATQDNPAGMAFFDKASRQATFTHSNLFSVGALSRDFVSYAQGDSGFGVRIVPCLETVSKFIPLSL